MATRRPRVPKSAHRPAAQRPLVSSAAPAGQGSTVAGYSAKVIPLDAAPSRHLTDAPADGVARPAGRGTRPADAAEPGTAPTAAPEHDGRQHGNRSDDAGTSRSTDRTPGLPVQSGAPVQAAEPGTPALTAAERRAAARRELLRRARPGGTAAARRTTSAVPPPRPSVVEPVPARNFSGRSIALLVVLFVAAVLLAPTLRVYLDQQSELRAVQEDITEQQEEQRRLTAQIARWDDPAYIQQQARDRFNLVMPGEKAYMVIGGDEAVEDPVPPPASPSEVNPDMPWADALWDSVVRAGTD